MNGVYFCEGIDFSNTNNIGIENKIRHQIACLKVLGNVKVVTSIFKDTTLEKIKFLLPIVSDREYKRNHIIDVLDDNTQYIYIRKSALCNSFYKLLKEIKSRYPKIIILMEITTYPFHSEYQGISKLMNIKSISCEKKLKNVVNRIVTYSNDDYIWNIKTIKTSNCVVYDEIKPRTSKYKLKKNEIRLTCVANFTFWHGLDRLINGINNYDGKYNIVLNVVGGGEELDNLKKIANNNSNIIFYGPKSGKELEEIFDKTDIAIDALGRHRSGVYYNSSLKGKEYCARGIPIISAVKTELDYLEGFNYYLSLPPDDSYINIDEIVKFYERIYLNNSEKNISNVIRNCTYKMFDYKYGYEQIIKRELEILKEEKK